MGIKIMGIASAASLTNYAAECEMVSHSQIQLGPQAYIISHMTKVCKVYDVMSHQPWYHISQHHGLCEHRRVTLAKACNMRSHQPRHARCTISHQPRCTAYPRRTSYHISQGVQHIEL